MCEKGIYSGQEEKETYSFYGVTKCQRIYKLANMKLCSISNIKNELSRTVQSEGSNAFGWSFILSQQHLLRPNLALGSLLPDE